MMEKTGFFYEVRNKVKSGLEKVRNELDYHMDLYIFRLDKKNYLRLVDMRRSGMNNLTKKFKEYLDNN